MGRGEPVVTERLICTNIVQEPDWAYYLLDLNVWRRHPDVAKPEAVWVCSPDAGLKREKGWVYFLDDDGYLCRTQKQHHTDVRMSAGVVAEALVEYAKSKGLLPDEHIAGTLRVFEDHVVLECCWDVTKRKTCETCEGEGDHNCPDCDGYGRLEDLSPCQRCDGEGTAMCNDCNGYGDTVVSEHESVLEECDMDAAYDGDTVSREDS